MVMILESRDGTSSGVKSVRWSWHTCCVDLIVTCTSHYSRISNVSKIKFNALVTNLESMLRNALLKARIGARCGPLGLLRTAQASCPSLGDPALSHLPVGSPLSSFVCAAPVRPQQSCFHTEARGMFVGGDTIYALSTAPGRAGIAIVRISGPSCREVSTQLSLLLHASLTAIQDLREPLPK
jgi:hypothetical protein